MAGCYRNLCSLLHLARTKAELLNALQENRSPQRSMEITIIYKARGEFTDIIPP